MNKGITLILMVLLLLSCNNNDDLQPQVSTISIEVLASEYDANRHFFLSHYFRDNYDRWLNNVPEIRSEIQIRRVEVFVLARSNSNSATNFIALLDLGESDPKHVFRENHEIVGSLSNDPESNNDSNELFANLSDKSREVAAMNDFLEEAGFEEHIDHITVTTGRKLDPAEYFVHEQLGYITLLRRLQNDEVLAVSYEYTLRGERFLVGELQEDYLTRSQSEVILLKMLRPNHVNTTIPTWDLMMKNIYNLDTTFLEGDPFDMEVLYQENETSQAVSTLQEGQNTTDIPLIQIVGLDHLNKTGDRRPDGEFDFITGLTIDPWNGRLFFTVLEPFGSHLQSWFDVESESELIEKYVYDALYSATQSNAELDPKNRFKIKLAFPK